MIAIFIILVLSGGMATAGLFFVLRAFSKKTTQAGGAMLGPLEKRARELDKATTAAVDFINTQIPLAEALEKEKELAQIRADLAAEMKRLEELDTRLTTLQDSVDEAEAQHNQVKRGKEGADALAEELKGSKERLTTELSDLDSRLQESQKLLASFEKDGSITAPHVPTVEGIVAILAVAREQLRVAAEGHAMNSSRFVNLESQFSELEEEFTKIVAREISGE